MWGMQIDRGEVGMSASVQVRGQLMRLDSLRPFIMDSKDQAQVLRVGSKTPPYILSHVAGFWLHYLTDESKMQNLLSKHD